MSEKLRGLILVGAVSLSALTLTGCGSPCAELPAGNADAMAALNAGMEVEREVEGDFGDAECTLQPDGSWEEDSD